LGGGPPILSQLLSLSGPEAEKEKNNKVVRFLCFPESRQAFRTVPVGLWADPVVTRKFHVASRRINNLRELSGEQAAEPHQPITTLRRDFFTASQPSFPQAADPL